ncbi:putative cyclic di-GMP phosphodiesterase PdeG [bioreactor metagenome]|uniref:Putative cyclic di-GMP phosphodiesterase PdeG n=3 Tax=root TaxID=1 RepID=A0A645GBY5_9ZZZZ
MDREFFVRNLNEENKVIIKTMIDLIKSLHMKVVAEGVETKEYVDFLLQCGCDAIQGFYYHKPMSMTDFNILLDNVSD